MERQTLALLFDYYGDLLTSKQRDYCDLYYNQDFSLAEIAEQAGISRQGVHDALTHAESALLGFEKVLGCAKRDRELLTALEPLLYHSDAHVQSCVQRAVQILQSNRE